ncbi:xylulose kinase [Nocardia sp. ET3-3]|uniref:Xylulose kinase n=1 Tax=Nocardia terrae TaxID=2675851 RepID=A0A7K1V6W9_9NOCA|nr:FGGY family carbohydrate kinase [Nocardia terrae]MVU82384.1 xylulose kinase [Nocardia terrae]
MTLVAGVDSSTQSCKVVIREAETGRLVRSGRAAHPSGTEVHPECWWSALLEAITTAGGIDDVAVIAVAGQQHGLVCLDESGRVVRDALLWNDTRSADAARDLVDELGAPVWAQRTGSVPVASFTVTKLRWLAEREPDSLARTAAVCLPHDWLTWRLRGGGLEELTTDRSDASGTGYFDSRTGEYCRDLLELACGRGDLLLPRLLGPSESTASSFGPRLAAGAGDNAAARLGLAAGTDVVVSLGTSGVVSASSVERPADPTGIVAGFADATDRHLPLVCTLNAARVLDTIAAVLGIGLQRLSELALSAAPGSDGLVLVPYFDGERTPNLPTATGALHGLTTAAATPATVARAAVEGMLCGVGAGLEALRAHDVPITAVRLIGGAAALPAVREIAPTVFGVPVLAPEPGEYVADGAARQAAWALHGGDEPPPWPESAPARRYEAETVVAVRERYQAAQSKYLER